VSAEGLVMRLTRKLAPFPGLIQVRRVKLQKIETAVIQPSLKIIKDPSDFGFDTGSINNITLRHFISYQSYG
jgi:hypothetical protein